MADINISHHISHQYNKELEDVRQRVLAMGGLVEQQTADALKAMTEGNSQLAELVVAKDHQVNGMEVLIDEECTHVLACRQPAASDLRLIVAVIKTITDLERIGDEAERIARMGLHLTQLNCPGNHCFEIQSMAARVQKMLHDALDAFARLDVEAAVQVARDDLHVDQEYEGMMRQLITFMMEDPRTIGRALDMMWAARALERIGDHARNIGEYIVFLVKGKDVRHTPLEQMEKAARGDGHGQPPAP
jgi:phosphate transport system protein